MKRITKKMTMDILKGKYASAYYGKDSFIEKAKKIVTEKYREVQKDYCLISYTTFVKYHYNKINK
jgi:hypothetical protein